MLNRLLISWIVYAGVMGFALGGSFVSAYFMPPPQHQEGTGTENSASEQNAKEKTDEALARYTLWLTIFTGVMAFATIGLGIATVGLYATGEKQIEVALKAANAADLSARAAVAIEMPVIRVVPDRFGYGSSQNGDGPRIEYCSIGSLDFYNGGRTKALPIEVRCGGIVGDSLPEGGLIYTFTQRFPIDGIGFVPDSKDPWRMYLHGFEIALASGDTNRLMNRQTNLWFYCCIAYFDFMQIRHEAEFCWQRHELFGGGVLLADATPAYNQKT